MFNGHIERSWSLNIVIRIKGNNYFTRISFVENIQGVIFLLIRIYDIGVCTLIFVTDEIVDCKRNLSRFCNVAVFSGFSVEIESMLTFVITLFNVSVRQRFYKYWIFAVWKKSFGDFYSSKCSLCV